MSIQTRESGAHHKQLYSMKKGNFGNLSFNLKLNGWFKWVSGRSWFSRNGRILEFDVNFIELSYSREVEKVTPFSL